MLCHSSPYRYSWQEKARIAEHCLCQCAVDAISVAFAGVSVSPCAIPITPIGVGIFPAGLNIQPIGAYVVPEGVNVQPQVCDWGSLLLFSS